ncbi:hypothetical protein M0811_06179 [Anaeramoeba ignava]|uniref:Transmembrane protein n=1 Tax=Anaeramoeba ignava TaxID=1746090 RepID=A0A9Q0RDY7_ANAIG|nr:hypothetical protein M0811_06179 [Anaeramoeba ignava]
MSNDSEGVLCLVVIFCWLAFGFIGGFIWLGVDQAYVSDFEKTDCKVVDKYLDYTVYKNGDDDCVGADTLNYISRFQVTYSADGNDYEEMSCWFGRECETSRGHKCSIQGCSSGRREGVCRRYIHTKKSDFYTKFEVGKSYDCWYWKDDPRYSTFKLAKPSYLWSLFLWIPSGLFWIIVFIYYCGGNLVDCCSCNSSSEGCLAAVFCCKCGKRKRTTRTYNYDSKPQIPKPIPKETTKETKVKETKISDSDYDSSSTISSDSYFDSDSEKMRIKEELKKAKKIEKENNELPLQNIDSQKDITINYDFKPEYQENQIESIDYELKPEDSQNHIGPINYNIGNIAPDNQDPNSNQQNKEF